MQPTGAHATNCMGLVQPTETHATNRSSCNQQELMQSAGTITCNQEITHQLEDHAITTEDSKVNRWSYINKCIEIETKLTRRDKH
jgi:hypothetical protein